jgi:hypothetical protein
MNCCTDPMCSSNKLLQSRRSTGLPDMEYMTSCRPNWCYQLHKPHKNPTHRRNYRSSPHTACTIPRCRNYCNYQPDSRNNCRLFHCLSDQLCTMYNW